MTNSQKHDADDNPFKKLFDDAGRSLTTDIGDLGFIDDLTDISEDRPAYIPFPYGIQPESRCGWK